VRSLSHLARGAGLCAGITLLSGCGGSQAQSASALPAQSGANGTLRDRSWITSDAKNGALLYVSDAGETVAVLSYPAGKRVGALTGFQMTLGLCSDGKGNVFVVDFKAQQIVEYAHGGTSPIATLDDAGNYPSGCAVDPKSGDLAVAGGFPPHANGNVAIYKGAQGSPTVYFDSFAWFNYCTYDGNGNVFAAGTDGEQFFLSELPAGSGPFLDMGVRGVNPIASIEWDGEYLAVESPTGDPFGPATIDQVNVSGSTATIVHMIELYTKQNTNPRRGAQFWIYRGRIVNPESVHKRIGLWDYPAGGEAIRTIRLDTGPMVGLTVSGP
jgi:hypothetical protein